MCILQFGAIDDGSRVSSGHCIHYLYRSDRATLAYLVPSRVTFGTDRPTEIIDAYIRHTIGENVTNPVLDKFFITRATLDFISQSA